MTRYAYWLAAVIFLTLVSAKFDSRTGFTSLIRFGETWQERRHSSLQSLPISTVARSSGYDGQFYAQIALDPLLRGSELEKAIDTPTYRSRRILTPAIAALLGHGNPWWTLQAYALLNVISWLFLGWLLRIWINGCDWLSFARWIGCMFSVGVLDSVRQSLVDLPALLLLSLATFACGQSRISKSAVWLALGNLAKETTAIGMIALYATRLADRTERRRKSISFFMASVPITVWWLYVDQRFSTKPAVEGLGNFAWPLMGVFEEIKTCVRELLLGNIDGRYTFGLIAIAGLTIQAVSLWRKPDLSSPWWRVGAAYSLLLPFLSLWVWSGYWAACRALLPLTISFNLLLPANRAFWPMWIVGNLTMLHGLWRFL